MKKTILFIFSVFLSGVVHAQSAPVSPELSAVLPQTAPTATGAEQHVSALNASELSDEVRRELIREAADKKEWTRAFELILPLALKGLPGTSQSWYFVCTWSRCSTRFRKSLLVV